MKIRNIKIRNRDYISLITFQWLTQRVMADSKGETLEWKGVWLAFYQETRFQASGSAKQNQSPSKDTVVPPLSPISIGTPQPAWKAAVDLQHQCCKFSSSWSEIEKSQRTKSRRRHVRNFYSTNFAPISPPLQINNFYVPVKPLLTHTQAYRAPQGLPQVNSRSPFAQPLLAGPVRRH